MQINIPEGEFMPKGAFRLEEGKEVKPGEKLVGYSLSTCVRQILEGKIREEDVEQIIAGTNAQDDKQWEELMNMYKGSYWKDSPEEGVAIATRLKNAGKLKQPRVEGTDVPNISDGYWTRVEETNK